MLSHAIIKEFLGRSRKFPVTYCFEEGAGISIGDCACPVVQTPSL